ncbi:MAG: NAD(P)-dependent oxidoreductase [Chloroflexi bacterium]|nr:NAD(P)-dependent oxidoreductase [Chloroflexota bacterium]MCC6895663.1 NAD(P)-dependent oxidoreductase [Anaerolineae bacterium]
MKNVVVTGGSGKAGRAVVRDLVEHGYNVLNVDVAPSREPITRFLKADLTDLGQTFEALAGAEAVVHLAAIPAPELLPDEITFRINMASTYNVFSAAVKLGLKRVVWASSETTLGLPFDKEQPAYAPIDEAHPLYPESSYAMSKVLGEEMARQFNRWSGIPFVGFRISNIMEPDDYQKFPSFNKDAKIRKWNLWGYVDARDVAQACRLGLEAAVTNADHYIIAAADTCMSRANRELMAEIFPGVELRGEIGDTTTLLSIDKAKRVLGYAPQYSWREYVKPE